MANRLRRSVTARIGSAEVREAPAAVGADVLRLVGDTAADCQETGSARPELRLPKQTPDAGIRCKQAAALGRLPPGQQDLMAFPQPDGQEVFR